MYAARCDSEIGMETAGLLWAHILFRVPNVPAGAYVLRLFTLLVGYIPAGTRRVAVRKSNSVS